jgi:hypothetical protein
MKEHFSDLTIETATDENGQFIILKQESCGNSDTVAIHPMHLRYMAEKLGLVETCEPQAGKTIAMLKRLLLVLHKRIEFLQEYLANHSDHKHADLSYEVTYATATLEIADEFCAEFEVQGEAEVNVQAGLAMQQASLI